MVETKNNANETGTVQLKSSNTFTLGGGPNRLFCPVYPELIVWAAVFDVICAILREGLNIDLTIIPPLLC